MTLHNVSVPVVLEVHVQNENFLEKHNKFGTKTFLTIYLSNLKISTLTLCTLTSCHPSGWICEIAYGTIVFFF